ncbi:protein FAR1-RELATED SEQUENCE 4-like isoform X3 [Spinacia oleracea]|uniref:Protein FAR1-RELATED SEQUENCE n=1 Tax=Spinacia oleracea TaxID=3562 RepID=A0ABM3RTR0_SPIOL|nr:protein FAR1-RELATED SEQUENCE 4-like isoform X3 [Spinacia oleracea]
MESRANDERAADVNCSRFTRPLVGEFAYERKCQKVYTDAKFVEVQVQCTRVCYVTPVSKKDISDVEVEHTVSDRVWIWSKFLKKEISLGGPKRTYVVLFNKETLFGKCDCKYFECHGIVCRHIIKVLDMENVVTVPASYIMDRWRKDIQRKHTLVKVAYHDPEETKEINRYDKIMNAVEPAALLGSQNEQKLDIMLEMVRAAMLRMDVSDVVTAEVADNKGGAASVLNRRGSDGPPTPRSVNKPPNSSGEKSPCLSPPILAKDPVPRGGVKAHRPREKRFIPPGENTKPAKKQVRKNKKGVAEDAPPEQPATNLPVPFKQPMDPVAINPDYTGHQGIKYGNAQNNFHPGWPNQFVMAGYNTVNVVDPQHQVGGNNVRACVGQMSGTLIYPQHNYNNGAPMQNYQASATRVGGGVATNLFPQSQVRMSVGGIRMSQDGDGLIGSQDPCVMPLSQNMSGVQMSQISSNVGGVHMSQNLSGQGIFHMSQNQSGTQMSQNAGNIRYFTGNVGGTFEGSGNHFI